MRSSGAGTSNKIPLQESGQLSSSILITLPILFIAISCFNYNHSNLFSSTYNPISITMSLNSSLNSTDSDVFYVEQLSDEPSPRRNNTPNILNSTERTDHQEMRMPSVSTIASPQPHFVTINDDSNEVTIPYGFGRQLPIVPPSLNDLNLPPNPFGVLNTMQRAADTRDDNNPRDSPESPEPSTPSPIATPPVNVSAFNSWETSHTTSNDDTFYSEDEPRRVYWTSPLHDTFHSEDEPRRIYLLSPSPSTPPPPRKMKRKLSLGMSFPKDGGVSQHICEACGQIIPAIKDTPGPSNRN